MSSDRFKKIEEIYHAALEISPEKQAAFLEKECGEDLELKKEVEALLYFEKNPVSIIQNTPEDLAAEIFSNEEDANDLVGKTVDHYKIQKLLGKGGMGTVYLAQDTQLVRPVALKVLPTYTFAAHDSVKRFMQEARAASALNHPNILTVYEIGETEDTRYIATEFIDGNSLKDLLKSESLDLRSVLEIAIQIVSALDAAHSAGIVHRDIKPDNIMVRPDGLVKVLDFGIAKLTEKSPREINSDDSVKTGTGMIMGTANYMSPEQAKSKNVDARTDIFSFGIVLYKMLSGSLPFEGDSAMETIASIIHKEPKLLDNSKIPPELEKILAKTLQKDKADRYQTSQDLLSDLKKVKQALEFQDKLETSTQTDQKINAVTQMRTPSTADDLNLTTSNTTKTDSIAIKKSSLNKTVSGVFAILFISAICFGIWFYSTGMQLSSLNIFSTDTSEVKNVEYQQLTSQSGQELFPNLSPDGKTLIYSSNKSGNWDIYFRRVGGSNEINLTKDSDSDNRQAVFSPDGEQIAFRSERDGGGIFIMGATGESVRKIADSGFYPAWSPDGKEIVFSASDFTDPTYRDPIPTSLWIVNLSSEKKRELTKGDAIQPSWSPNGKRIAFWAVNDNGKRDIKTISAKGGEFVSVTEDDFLDWNPIWSPDGKYLYFTSDRSGSMNVWQIRIDEENGRTLGGPEIINTPSSYSQHLSISNDGKRLAYAQTRNSVNILKYSFNPITGKVGTDPTEITKGTNRFQNPDVSPDGKWIAFDAIRNKQRDLFVMKSDGTEIRQVTNDIASERGPRWSPDGKKIVSYSDRSGKSEGWVVNSDGSDLSQITQIKNDNQAKSVIWSPNGKELLVNISGKFPFFIEAGKPFSEQTPRPMLKETPSGYDIVATSWSADGNRIIADKFNETPSVQGIVSYDIDTGKYQNLTDFGASPYWLNDSKRVIFFDEQSVYLLDTTTRKTKKILSVSPNLIQNLTITPDNLSIYIALEKNEADVWLADFE